MMIRSTEYSYRTAAGIAEIAEETEVSGDPLYNGAPLDRYHFYSFIINNNNFDNNK